MYEKTWVVYRNSIAMEFWRRRELSCRKIILSYLGGYGATVSGSELYLFIIPTQRLANKD